MPFDPTKPATGSALQSQVIRDQLNALHDEIQSVPAGPPGPQGPEGPPFGGAMVDTVNTLPSGSMATASALQIGSVVHFDFGIPQGPPGEVTLSQLATELATLSTSLLAQTSNNSNVVAELNLTVSNPPTQAEVQAVANKLDELIAALRR